MINANLPKVVIIGSMAFTVNFDAEATRLELEGGNHIAQSSAHEGYIQILPTAPIERQWALFWQEVAYQLLFAAGADEDTCTKYYSIIGNVLYNTLDTDTIIWLSDIKPSVVPTQVKVNGIPYALHFDRDDYLEGKGLAGECDFTNTEILLQSTLKDTARGCIACHEVIHAVLHEACCEELNEEKYVEPLGRFFYRFMVDNGVQLLRGNR